MRSYKNIVMDCDLDYFIEHMTIHITDEQITVLNDKIKFSSLVNPECLESTEIEGEY